jgi:digeranylgeranylglycerophospholipid reductase
LVDFDVLVVGGGASGIWAAVTAARSGGRVLLLERRSRIGERVICAEGLGRDGLSQLVELNPEWVASEIHGIRFCAPDGSLAEVGEVGAGFIAHKDVFLRGLAGLAAGQGVEIWPAAEATDLRAQGHGWTAEVQRGSRRLTLRCGAVVAADGIRSSIGRRLGIVGPLALSEIFSCAQYTVTPIDLDPNVVEFHLGRETAPGGYGWVFPKGGRVANVGVGIVPGGDGDLTAVEYLSRFKQMRCPGSKILGFVVGGVPSARDPFKACADGVFLAGDAARIADPVSGAGIVPGMASGAIAGKHAFIHAAGDTKPDIVRRSFVKSLKAEFKDRRMRYAVRRVLTRMDNTDLSRLVGLIGDYAAEGTPLRSDPAALVRFVARSMPAAFRLARHLVGV